LSGSPARPSPVLYDYATAEQNSRAELRPPKDWTTAIKLVPAQMLNSTTADHYPAGFWKPKCLSSWAAQWGLARMLHQLHLSFDPRRRHFSKCTSVAAAQPCSFSANSSFESLSHHRFATVPWPSLLSVSKKACFRSPPVRRLGYQPFLLSLAPVNSDLGFGGSKCDLQANVLVGRPRAAATPRSHPNLAKACDEPVELRRAKDNSIT
jgi:hypothetical protein